MIGDPYFMEIGIYRVPHDSFNSQYDRALAEHFEQQRKNSERVGLDFPEDARLRITDTFWRSYVAPWHYYTTSVSSAEVCANLREELERFQAAFRSGRFVLDLECFDGVSKHVDWANLVRDG